jgi:hypothetical protein
MSGAATARPTATASPTFLNLSGRPVPITTQAQPSVPVKPAVSTAPVRKKPLDLNTAGNEEAVRSLLADPSKTGVQFWYELQDSLMWRFNNHAGLGKIVFFPPSIAQVLDEHTRGEDYFVLDDPDDERKARALLTAAMASPQPPLKPPAPPSSKAGAHDSDDGSVDGSVEVVKQKSGGAENGSRGYVHDLVSSSEDEGDDDDDHGAPPGNKGDDTVSGSVQKDAARPWLARPAEGKPFKPKLLLKRFSKWYKQQGDANEVTVKDRVRNAKHLLLTLKVLREGTADEADRVWKDGTLEWNKPGRKRAAFSKVRRYLSVVDRKPLSLRQAPSRKRAQPTEVVKREGGAGLGLGLRQGPEDESMHSDPEHELDNVSDDDDDDDGEDFDDDDDDDDDDLEAGPQSKKRRLSPGPGQTPRGPKTSRPSGGGAKGTSKRGAPIFAPDLRPMFSEYVLSQRKASDTTAAQYVRRAEQHCQRLAAAMPPGAFAPSADGKLTGVQVLAIHDHDPENFTRYVTGLLPAFGGGGGKRGTRGPWGGRLSDEFKKHSTLIAGVKALGTFIPLLRSHLVEKGNGGPPQAFQAPQVRRTWRGSEGGACWWLSRPWSWCHGRSHRLRGRWRRQGWSQRRWRRQ